MTRRSRALSLTALLPALVVFAAFGVPAWAEWGPGEYMGQALERWWGSHGSSGSGDPGLWGRGSRCWPGTFSRAGASLSIRSLRQV